MTLRETVERYCFKKLGRKPDLENPRGYNDKINWLKLYDHMPEHVICCDKLAARAYVVCKLGNPEAVLQIYGEAKAFASLSYPGPCMVKCNHDSGSTARVTDESAWRRAAEKIERGLARTYGTAAGEWAYRLIEPRCFTEALMPGAIVDYKFHCCNGRIKWVQIIAERASGHPVEYITDEDCEPLGLHLDHQFRHGRMKPRIPENWLDMIETAKRLSADFRYVRVDLYSSQGRVIFGELTFWPKAGIYKTRDERAFGEMLDFDMSYKREPIVK